MNEMQQLSLIPDGTPEQAQAVGLHYEIVAAAQNSRETEKNGVHRAELLAIGAACRGLGGWRV